MIRRRPSLPRVSVCIEAVGAVEGGPGAGAGAGAGVTLADPLAAAAAAPIACGAMRFGALA